MAFETSCNNADIQINSNIIITNPYLVDVAYINRTIIQFKI